ncbi:MAG TPA: single-stranded DNA-binding protein [Oscillospiraceae bacterium]|nr:single-stranded DNA-binding protein [Oscillospiraceae bacterium]
MLNKVIIMGRLTAEPELRQTANNIPCCRFTVACDRNFVGQGQERQADFISVVAWRQTAEFVSKYFSKGSMIVVEGNLRTGSFPDKKYPEVKHYTTEVYADQVYFGETKKQGVQAPSSEPKQEKAGDTISIGNIGEFEEIIGDDDVPF